MTSRTTDGRAAVARAVAEAGWRWVLDQVRWDDGPWIPESVPAPTAEAPADRDGMHSGIGGLAHVLAEIRLTRPWTDEEVRLAEAIGVRVRAGIAASTDCTFFDGLVGDIGVLTALADDGDEVGGGGGTADGVAAAVARLAELAEPDGWPQSILGPPRYAPDARISDATLGTGAVLLGALWAGRYAAPRAREVADRAVEVLLAEAEPAGTGLDWRFVPLRFRTDPADPPTDMPNFSHGLAGIATALALAGLVLGRDDATDAARRGAEHLVSLGDTSGSGLTVPRYLPGPPPAVADEDRVSFGWCHGAAGTSLLFASLERAGVTAVAGETPADWQRRCLRAVRTSGLPDRLRPGFWDNDGRCCGTAGVGEVFLDAWQRTGDPDDLAFALHLADVLVERAIVEGPHAWWRFVEHRAAEPLLPPKVGWMQGAAGIAGFLFRSARLEREGRSAAAVSHIHDWWALPG
jgi:hypothetical protein